MKKTNVQIAALLVAIGLFLLPGCQKPGPIEILDQTDDSDLIDLRQINPVSDTLLAHPGIDTAGPGSTQNFFGNFTFTAVRYDLPLRSDSFVHAEASLLDRTRPISINGRTIAYPSLDLGSITIDGDTLERVERRIPLMLPGHDTLAGFLYRLKNVTAYSPGSVYHWKASGSSQIGAFDIPFTAALAMNVLDITPRFVSITGPMTVHWVCANPTVTITISREGDLLQRQWVPILQMRVSNTKKGVTIPQKILEMLPVRRFQRFLFTFSSDIQFSTHISGYTEDVMIQSASVHNILLSVQP
jgi:hypothetical protein